MGDDAAGELLAGYEAATTEEVVLTAKLLEAQRRRAQLWNELVAILQLEPAGKQEDLAEKVR